MQLQNKCVVQSTLVIPRSKHLYQKEAHGGKLFVEVNFPSMRNRCQINNIHLDQVRGLRDLAMPHVCAIDKQKPVVGLQETIILRLVSMLSTFILPSRAVIESSRISTMKMPGSGQLPEILMPRCLPGCLSRVTVSRSSRELTFKYYLKRKLKRLEKVAHL